MFSSRKIFSGAVASAAVAGIMSLTGGSTPQVHAAAAPEMNMADVPIVLTAHVSSAVRDAYSSYTVRSGDTLSGISRKEYGSAGCWPGIWGANTGKIADPNIVYPGEGLAIPSGCSTHGPAVQTSAVTSSTQPGDHEPDGDSDDHGGSQPPPPVSGSGFYNTVLSFGQIEALWVAGGGPAWAEYHAARIAECESGGNRYAYNPSGATGLWQILGQVTDFGGRLTDPWVNVHNAVSKFRASGDTFAQWVCQ